MGADKITVLNIDDNEAARYVRRRLMTQAGFEVEDASTGAEALRLVEQVRPQLMLLDVLLPDVDGFEISRRVRQNAIGDQVAIIHISAEAPDAPSQVTGLETGADAYLVEPVDPRVLVATARALLRARAAERRERDEIARLRRSEEALRESEARLARTQEFSHVMTLHVSLDGRWLKLPRTFVRFLGYDNESEVVGRPFEEFTHPDDFWADWTQVQQLLRGEIKSFEMEKRFMRKDGSFTWGYLNCSIVTDEQGKPVHLLTYARDIGAQKRAEEALRESEERYRTLFESVDEGFCVIELLFDSNGRAYDYRFLEANPAFEKQTSLRGAIGKTIRELLPSQDQHWFDTYGRIALTGVPERFENRSAALGAYFDVYAFRIGPPELRRVAVLFRDVSERKRREADLAFVDEIGEDFARLRSTEDIMQTVGAKIGAYLNVDTCNFAEFDETRDEITIRYGWRKAGVPNVHGTYRVEEYLGDEFRRASRAGETVAVCDTQTDSRTEAQSWAALEIRSFMAVPFRVRGEWKFHVSVTASRPRQWREHEIELFQELAHRIFPRIERARAEEALRESEARQAFLLKVSDALRPLADPVRIQFEATRALGEHLGAGRAGYAECEGDGETVIIGPHYMNGLPGVEGRHHLADYGATLHSDLLSGRAVVRGDISNDPTLTDSEKAAFAALPLASMADVPLVKAGRLVAVLFVHYREAHDFTAAEMSLMEAVAERTWAAVERARAEAALRESEEKYRSLFETMDEGFALCEIVRDAQGRAIDFRCLEWNPAFEKRTGLNADHIRGQLASQALPGLGEQWLRTFTELVETKEPVRFEHRAEPLDRWHHISAFPRGGDRFAFLLDDITERRHADEALRDRERQFRELADSMPQLVWITDAGGYVTFFNHQWYDQLGAPEEQSLGNGWEQFLHPEDRDRAHNVWHASVETGAPYQVEYRFRTANGEYRWFLARGVPIRDEHGRITRWYGTCTDIDESKRAEERLRQTQKLKSVGLLAGGIAHDFNNLLTGIIGNASLALDDIVDAHAAARIKDVMKSAERAANLTRQLLAYSGKGQFIVRDIDVSQAVNEIADLVQFSIPKSVELVMNVRTRLPMVRMDPTQLQQVLMNLVINAGEAIGEANPGTITVATSTTHVDKPFVDAVGHDIAPGRYVCIEVNDTGTGIDDDSKSKIFEPFFTTKFTGRGLGLAAVAGILRTQRGGVTVKSEPGSGSTFCVYLPAAEKGGETGEEPAASRATILVVDDEATVRDVISAVLRRRGFHVLTASEGRDALAVCEREKVNIDAAVVDVVMPVMGANELMPALKTRCPKIKILLTSGYSETEARRLCAAYPGATFIQKPYTAQQIAEAVEQLVKVAD